MIVIVGLALGAQNLIQTNSIRQQITDLNRERNMQTLTSEWTSGGIRRVLTTTRKESETEAEFIASHAAAEAAALRQWPKDPQ